MAPYFGILKTTGTKGTVNWRFRLLHYWYLRKLSELNIQLFWPVIICIEEYPFQFWNFSENTWQPSIDGEWYPVEGLPSAVPR